MARATREQSEVTGQRILATATTLYAERGYAGTGLEEVAAAAAVTRGAVYHHYGSKQGLFQAVAAGLQGDVAAAVDRASAEAPSAWDGIVAGCRAFLETVIAEPYRRILLVDGPAVLGWRTWRDQDAAASARLLAAGLAGLAATGEITVASPEGAAALLSGAMNEAALRIADADDPAAELAVAWPDLVRMLNSLRQDLPTTPIG